MSGKRVLFICNSAYQLLTAVQIRRTIYAHEEADLILSNQLAGADKVSENARKTNVFGHVAYIENKKQAFANRFREACEDIKIIFHLRRVLGEYDIVCLSNISVFSILFLRLYQRRTSEVNIFEDGFVTYSKVFVRMDRASVISRLLLPQGVLGSVSHLFLFNPDLLDWHAQGIQVVAIPKLSNSNQDTIGVLNTIFDYAASPDRYDKSYLFMEESFYADHFPVNDVEIVEELARMVGKENVMVKLHPRNPENRFERLGYKTNHSYAIPWELIMLNTPLQGSTLVSISSCSILQPYLLLGIKVRSISLLNLLATKPGNMQGELGEYMQSLFNRFSEFCYSPMDMEDFRKHLV